MTHDEKMNRMFDEVVAILREDGGDATVILACTAHFERAAGRAATERDRQMVADAARLAADRLGFPQGPSAFEFALALGHGFLTHRYGEL